VEGRSDRPEQLRQRKGERLLCLRGAPDQSLPLELRERVGRRAQSWRRTTHATISSSSSVKGRSRHASRSWVVHPITVTVCGTAAGRGGASGTRHATAVTGAPRQLPAPSLQNSQIQILTTDAPWRRPAPSGRGARRVQAGGLEQLRRPVVHLLALLCHSCRGRRQLEPSKRLLERVTCGCSWLALSA
jgi:hypothetical protein